MVASTGRHITSCAYFLKIYLGLGASICFCTSPAHSLFSFWFLSAVKLALTFFANLAHPHIDVHAGLPITHDNRVFGPPYQPPWSCLIIHMIQFTFAKLCSFENAIPKERLKIIIIMIVIIGTELQTLFSFFLWLEKTSSYIASPPSDGSKKRRMKGFRWASSDCGRLPTSFGIFRTTFQTYRESSGSSMRYQCEKGFPKCPFFVVKLSIPLPMWSQKSSFISLWAIGYCAGSQRVDHILYTVSNGDNNKYGLLRKIQQ